MTKFGIYGGQYVPESLMNPLIELEANLNEALNDKEFMDEYYYYLKEYVGRESPLYFAKALTKKYGKAKIYLKREDLNHTGAHKINNVLGQILLAKKMGKTKVIAETGAGQHGVAVATVATMMGMECRIFMGKEDIERQSLNVFKMKLLNAEVVSVTSGTSTLKDATNEAIKEWVRSVEDTFYVIGSVVGPHPYPYMVREFQKIIGIEARRQILEKEGRLPNKIYACIGGGSNAIGIFHAFVKDLEVELIGAEAGGLGIETGKHAVVLSDEVPFSIGVFQGMKSALFTDEFGNIVPAHSISAGLDYPGVGPEHVHLKETKRATYKSIKDEEALNALKELSSVEGIIPAIESSHAVALALKEIKNTNKDEIIIINISGRGDKDMNTIMDFYNNNDINKLNK